MKYIKWIGLFLLGVIPLDYLGSTSYIFYVGGNNPGMALIFAFFALLPSFLIAYWIYTNIEVPHMTGSELKSLSTKDLKKRINLLCRKRILTKYNFYFYKLGEKETLSGLPMEITNLVSLTKSQITQLPNRYQRLLGYEKGERIKKDQVQAFHDSLWINKLTNFLITSILWGGIGLFFLILMYFAFGPGDDIDCSSPGSYGDRVACNRAYERAARGN